jgi:transposase-like protein
MGVIFVLRPLIGLVVQEVLEAEMNEALGAQKGERTEERDWLEAPRYLNMEALREQRKTELGGLLAAA